MAETKNKWIEIGGVKVSSDISKKEIERLKRQAKEDSDGHDLDLSGPLKRRVTMWIDYDVFAEIKRRAEAETAHGKYQTYLNDHLRRSIMGDPLESRVDAIEKQIKKLKLLIKKQA